MRHCDYRWVIRCNKIKVGKTSKISKDDLLMRDIDYYCDHNDLPRHSNDTKWSLHPLLLRGPYVRGNHSIPASLSTYRPWVLNWPERDNQIEMLKNLYNSNGDPKVGTAYTRHTGEVRIIFLLF